MSAIGIDLGTTNTVAAAVRAGQAAAIADGDGATLIPSVVSFHPNGSVLVGRSAKERRLIDAANTVYSIKRLIGRSWESEEVHRARQRFPFEMGPGPGQAPLVHARGESYTLAEISAFVLKKARSVAEAKLGTPVQRAVITVPANFNDLQRAATKVAGRVAGIEVMRIVNEPTAAALAYGFGRGRAERIAVYDLGGGTFDVTLLDLSQNVFEVLSTAGDTFLGGDDIDLAIAERMADSFLKTYKYDPRTNRQAFERLRSGAESVKVRLSDQERVRTTIPEVAHGPGGQPLDLSFEMTRAELTAVMEPLLDRTFEVCRQALETARFRAEDFQSILLVGGATRSPYLRHRVEEFFGKPPLTRLNPDEVVAIGAAIQANAIAGAERRKSALPPAPVPSNRPARPRQELKGHAPSSRQAPPPRRAKTTAAGIGVAPVPAPTGARPPSAPDAPVDDDLEADLKPSGHTAPSARLPRELEALDLETAPSDLSQADLGSGADAELSLPLPEAPAGSPQPPGGTPGPEPTATAEPEAPLLVDVTPLTLSVETVGGYCEPLIPRNSPVPCEHTREFVTAVDEQASVRVRISQGESQRFRDNTALGEIELDSLPKGPRGTVRVAVTFALDSSGILSVRARDRITGRATGTRVRLVGLPEAEDVAELAARHDQLTHA